MEEDLQEGDLQHSKVIPVADTDRLLLLQLPLF